MVAFLALVMLQGLYPKINEEAYFGFDGFGTTPYFSKIMSYNRYYLLKTFLHFSDNDTTNLSKLTKILPILDYLNRKFAGLYTPGKEIAIDESLLKWQGRLGFAQKISVGVKTYELCESSTGYLWSFRVYTGKHGPNRTQTRPDQDPTQRDPDLTDDDRQHPTQRDPDLPDDDRQPTDQTRPTNATAKILFDLMGPLLHRGHTLIMDNFYNSPLLARCLKHDKTDVFGTLRLTREFVPDAIKTMTKTDMRNGEVVASYCSDLVVMLWRDANLVGMISTYHPLQVGTQDKYNRVTFKPAIVLDYNKHMGGVDRKDQFLASQPLERTRNKVWYKKLFRRLYNAALFNCHIIYNHGRTRSLNHRKFRTILAEALLRIYAQIDLTTEPRLYQRRQTTTAVSRTVTVASSASKIYVEGNHFPIKNDSNHSRCRMCYRAKHNTRTAFKCEECNVSLCVIYCFKAYHKQPP